MNEQQLAKKPQLMYTKDQVELVNHRLLQRQQLMN